MSLRSSQTSLVRPLTLVAFGGNALLRSEDLGTAAEQRRRAEQAAAWLTEVVAMGHDLLIVHGNGPQVGQVLLQMEEAATKIPPSTLDVAVAQTQGSMGYLLEAALRNRLRDQQVPRPVASLLSMVVVDRDDEGFRKPSKPIGPFFSRYRAHILQRDFEWQMVEDAGRGWRKVVASPRPLEILGLEAIRLLLSRGVVVIAGGGGGIPVVRGEGDRVDGVEAVIDKDRTAALLARELRADLLVNLTGVEQVYRDYRGENQEAIPRMTVREARALLAAGEFPAGSMGPKIESVVDYVAATGGRAVISDVEHLRAAVAGEAGTRVVP